VGLLDTRARARSCFVVDTLFVDTYDVKQFVQKVEANRSIPECQLPQVEQHLQKMGMNETEIAQLQMS
jgi:hypothetical protein